MTPLTINDPLTATCDATPPAESMKAIFSDEWTGMVQALSVYPYASPGRFKCGLDDQHRGAHIVVFESSGPDPVITQVAWWSKPKAPRRRELPGGAA
jgi:hypothetical protein